MVVDVASASTSSSSSSLMARPSNKAAAWGLGLRAIPSNRLPPAAVSPSCEEDADEEDDFFRGGCGWPLPAAAVVPFTSFGFGFGLDGAAVD